MKFIPFFLLTTILTSGLTLAQSPVQPMPGRRSAAVLRGKSLEFKDLTKNNRLGPYERMSTSG